MAQVKSMSYTELKAMLGVEKLNLFNGKGTKRGFAMLDDKCVAVLKQGLTVEEYISAPVAQQRVVLNEEQGTWYLTTGGGVEY